MSAEERYEQLLQQCPNIEDRVKLCHIASYLALTYAYSHNMLSILTYCNFSDCINLFGTLHPIPHQVFCL
jgi:hypothetical protein